MKRKVEIGTEKYTAVFAEDEPGAGGANHQYSVQEVVNGTEVGFVHFQNGPIQEAGVNGVMNEDLIAMVIDRLQAFQNGPYKCRENALAITKFEEGLMWLRKRTEGRERRNVEGTSQV